MQCIIRLSSIPILSIIHNKGLFSACAVSHSEICKGELHPQWLIALIQNTILLIIHFDSYYLLSDIWGWMSFVSLTFFFCKWTYAMLHRKPAGCRHELSVKCNLHQNYLSEMDFYSELNTVWNKCKKKKKQRNKISHIPALWFISLHLGTWWREGKQLSAPLFQMRKSDV